MSKLDIYIITQKDLIEAGCFNIPEAVKIARDAFLLRAKNLLIFPDKVSLVFDQESQNRINCLPAGSMEESVYGMKWVSVFPGNPHLYGVQNVSAVILLSELKTGFPKAFMEGTLCSNLRTAATSAVAADYLARREVESIGFIGAGEQAKSHLLTMMYVRPSIKKCYVSSRTIESEKKFITHMSRLYPNLNFIACNSSYRDAVIDSDIIVTAISGQEKILQADWIKPGAFYCHVGGLEDDYSVPLKASKIVCDDWSVVKHRTQTISRMYKDGFLKDENIYCDIHDLVSGKNVGRENDDEFIYFNTVGMSYLDILLANRMYQKVIEAKKGTVVCIQDEGMFDIDSSKIKL